MGGDTRSGYAYVIKAGGLVPEKDYPYTARDGKCKENIVKEDAVAKIMGYNYATDPSHKNETLMALNLVSTGPISTTASRSPASPFPDPTQPGTSATRGQSPG